MSSIDIDSTGRQWVTVTIPGDQGIADMEVLSVGKASEEMNEKYITNSRSHMAHMDHSAGNHEKEKRKKGKKSIDAVHYLQALQEEEFDMYEFLQRCL